MKATRMKLNNTVQLLMEKGASANALNLKGESAISIAKSMGAKEILDILMGAKKPSWWERIKAVYKNRF